MQTLSAGLCSTVPGYRPWFVTPARSDNQVQRVLHSIKRLDMDLDKEKIVILCQRGISNIYDGVGQAGIPVYKYGEGDGSAGMYGARYGGVHVMGHRLFDGMEAGAVMYVGRVGVPGYRSAVMRAVARLVIIPVGEGSKVAEYKELVEIVNIDDAM